MTSLTRIAYGSRVFLHGSSRPSVANQSRSIRSTSRSYARVRPPRRQPVTLTDFQKELCATSRWDFSDLRALFVSCTLKPSPEPSHTEGLMRIAMEIMEKNGVGVDFVRAV